jgi:hypothetical protein
MQRAFNHSRFDNALQMVLVPGQHIVASLQLFDPLLAIRRHNRRSGRKAYGKFDLGSRGRFGPLLVER